MAMTTINPATGDPMVMLHTWRLTAIDVALGLCVQRPKASSGP